MSTTGYVMGYLMLIFGVYLCLHGVDQRLGEMAVAGAILISTTWFGFFAVRNRSDNEESGE